MSAVFRGRFGQTCGPTRRPQGLDLVEHRLHRIQVLAKGLQEEPTGGGAFGMSLS